MLLGKIVKSNAHTDYVCQVYGKQEIEQVPDPGDFAFGTFVKIELASGWLVGVIYDTVLLNPDFGRLGPRLSPAEELAIFSPDYLNERAILVGISVVGQVDADSIIRQGVAPLAAASDASVYQMDAADVVAFHSTLGGLSLAYVPLLMAQPNPITGFLVRSILGQLGRLMPDHLPVLTVINDDLAWQTQIIPVRRA